MKKDTIVIGTRSSKLALWQAEYVKGRLEEEYPGLKVELKLMTTKGDKILDAPLAKIGGKGLFTKELEMDMLSGGIDLAVHSLKDMPTELPEGLTLAAITSLMSLVEVSTAFYQEEFHVSRKKATLIVVAVTGFIGVFCSLSLGGYDGLKILGMSLFDLFDFVTGQIFLPVVGFLTCIFIGWFVPHKIVHDEFTNWGTVYSSYFHLYIFLVKYVCPICILFIFLHQFGLI